jgi:glycosyltransferase involved in cell wall biosynthesis
LLSGRDIICLYCEPWETPLRTSKHHLMTHLSRLNRILYVEQPIHPLAILRRSGGFAGQLHRWKAGLRQVAPNIHTLLGAVPLPYHRAAPLTNGLWANTFNQRAFLPSLRHAAQTLEFRDPIIWMYYPHAITILDQLRPALCVLHIIDDWMALPGLPISFEQLEQQAVRRADLVITSSVPLFESKRKLNSRTHLVRHGADIELFDKRGLSAEPPPDLAGLARPIVGYYGALHKLDPALVKNLVLRHPNWSFVFIGPVTGVQGADVSWATGLPNVRFVGERPQHQLPAYLGSFAAVLFPFRRDRLTYSMCPIKAYECLAAGIPVVSVSLPEIDVLKPHLYSAESADELDALLIEAMNEPISRGRERAVFARQFSWQSRIKTIEDLAADALNAAERKAAHG